MGCGGRGGAIDEQRLSGRRSRVVLTPRRWCQVSRNYPRDDGGKRARSPGRARNKPLKPLRAGMPGCSGGPVVTNARVYYTTRAAAGASAPGIPHALKGRRFLHNSGALRRGKAKMYTTVIASEAKQSSFGPAPQKAGLLRRGACYRARIRATRWLLEMTEGESYARTAANPGTAANPALLA